MSSHAWRLLWRHSVSSPVRKAGMRFISTIRSDSAAAHSAHSAPSDHSARADRNAVGFVVRVLVWIVALFGLLRLPWVQTHLLIPFAGLQQNLGCLITGASRSAVTVDLSCTGSDASRPSRNARRRDAPGSPPSRPGRRKTARQKRPGSAAFRRGGKSLRESPARGHPG